MKKIDLLGTPLLATTYDELANQATGWAGLNRTVAVDFSNTQIVTMRRNDPAFREMTTPVDFFVPDGMPLVWCLNGRGAGLSDRVYGPVFMRHFLDHSPKASKHYLVGGSVDCGQRLRERFATAEFVGSFHGRCREDGTLEGPSSEEVLADIQHCNPDYIWIGLGTPKQYAWLAKNKAHIRRGVFLTVGFAFDVNAGTKRDAPLWMQQAGLTWLFRLASEPRRLLTRYLRYNSLFLYYLAHDALTAGR